MRWLYAFWLMMWLAVLHGQPVVVAKAGGEHYSNTAVSDQNNGSKALRPGALLEVTLRSTYASRSGPPDHEVGIARVAELPAISRTFSAQPAIDAEIGIARQLTGGQHRPRAPPA